MAFWNFIFIWESSDLGTINISIYQLIVGFTKTIIFCSHQGKFFLRSMHAPVAKVKKIEAHLATRVGSLPSAIGNVFLIVAVMLTL